MLVEVYQDALESPEAIEPIPSAIPLPSALKMANDMVVIHEPGISDRRGSAETPSLDDSHATSPTNSSFIPTPRSSLHPSISSQGHNLDGKGGQHMEQFLTPTGLGIADYPPSSASSSVDDLVLQDTAFPMPPTRSTTSNSSSSGDHPDMNKGSYIERSLSSSPRTEDKGKRRGSFLGIGSLSITSRSRKERSDSTASKGTPVLEEQHFQSLALQARQQSQSSLKAGSPVSDHNKFPIIPNLLSSRSYSNLSRSDFDTATQGSSQTSIAFIGQLPRSPATKSSLQRYQERSEFLLKHSSFSFGLRQRNGSWKPRLVMLTESQSENGMPRFFLHTFKSNGPNDTELERMRLTRNSIICVTDEIPGGKLYVLKIVGQLAVAPETNSQSEREESWFFSMNGIPELSSWMKLLKGITLQLRGVVPDISVKPDRVVSPPPTLQLRPPANRQASLRSEVSIAHPYASSHSDMASDEALYEASYTPTDIRHRRNKSLEKPESILLRPNWRDSILSMTSQASDDSCLEPRIAQRLSTDLTGSIPASLSRSMSGRDFRTEIASRKRDSLIFARSQSGPPPSAPLPPVPALQPSVEVHSNTYNPNRQSTISMLSDASTVPSLSSATSVSYKRISGSSLGSINTPATTYSDISEFPLKPGETPGSPPRPVRNPKRGSPQMSSGSISLGTIQPARRSRTATSHSLSLLEEEGAIFESPVF